jgi:hypothetical protein
MAFMITSLALIAMKQATVARILLVNNRVKFFLREFMKGFMKTLYPYKANQVQTQQYEQANGTDRLVFSMSPCEHAAKVDRV